MCWALCDRVAELHPLAKTRGLSCFWAIRRVSTVFSIPRTDTGPWSVAAFSIVLFVEGDTVESNPQTFVF